MGGSSSIGNGNKPKTTREGCSAVDLAPENGPGSKKGGGETDQGGSSALPLASGHAMQLQTRQMILLCHRSVPVLLLLLLPKVLAPVRGGGVRQVCAKRYLARAPLCLTKVSCSPAGVDMGCDFVIGPLPVQVSRDPVCPSRSHVPFDLALGSSSSSCYCSSCSSRSSPVWLIMPCLSCTSSVGLGVDRYSTNVGD
jgi:hypothetical protein